MTETLNKCLAYLGRGNAKEWRKGAYSQGGFSFTLDGARWMCQYSPRGIALQKYGSGGKKTFTPAMCDAVAGAGKGQLSMF